MVYGTPFEQLEDEEKTAISKRPKGVQDEIVTDERGKRRFHGAFTGGFSAGYFNTAGSKHGWVPQTFRSTRSDRAEKLDQSAEDFMDEEDLGEFGIAARKVRTKMDFMDSMAMPGEKKLLAWERSTAAPGSSTAADVGTNLAQKLTEILRPVNDSVGVRLLKKMGWRPGKGIGAKMTRRELEKQKVIDAKSSGKRADFDEEAVNEMEERVNGADFAPDDITMAEIRQKNGMHGLGYKPLEERGVLDEGYGIKTSALKLNKKSKGIRGQAFGVGAFEDEDEDIYTNYDLSQYDFEVGASSSSAHQEVSKFDSTFVPASSSSKVARKFFVALMPPQGWRLRSHKAAAVQTVQLKLPDVVAKASERLTPFQRAKLLGERDHSVMEMLSSQDRHKLFSLGKRKGDDQKKTTEREAQRQGRSRAEVEPFEEEPMKAHRFRQYVHYLKRGIPFPQPADMTRLEWEKELEEFKDALSTELRALLPEVQNRQKPLAKIDFSKPIAEHFKSRFEKESGNEDIKYGIATTSTKDPKIEAVGNKQFGDLTRQKYEWHPAKELCKRFNVNNPYPDSQIVGTPGLSRRAQKDYATEYSLMDFGGALRDTSCELMARRQHPSKFDQRPTLNEQHGKDIKSESKDIQLIGAVNSEEINNKGDELAPMELLAAIFGMDEDEEEPLPSDEEGEEKEMDKLITIPAKKLTTLRTAENAIKSGHEKIETNGIKTKVITVMDLVEDDDVYGPAMPSEEFLKQDYSPKEQQIEENGKQPKPITIEIGSSESEEDIMEGSRKRKKSSKKKHDSNKRHKNSSKKKKSKKKKHSSRENSQSD